VAFAMCSSKGYIAADLKGLQGASVCVRAAAEAAQVSHEQLVFVSRASRRGGCGPVNDWSRIRRLLTHDPTR
jgi:hypothetical protein